MHVFLPLVIYTATPILCAPLCLPAQLQHPQSVLSDNMARKTSDSTAHHPPSQSDLLLCISVRQTVAVFSL